MDISQQCGAEQSVPLRTLKNFSLHLYKNVVHGFVKNSTRCAQ